MKDWVWSVKRLKGSAGRYRYWWYTISLKTPQTLRQHDVYLSWKMFRDLQWDDIAPYLKALEMIALDVDHYGR